MLNVSIIFVWVSIVFERGETFSVQSRRDGMYC
jgi:hypothetical protein